MRLERETGLEPRKFDLDVRFASAVHLRVARAMAQRKSFPTPGVLRSSRRLRLWRVRNVPQELAGLAVRRPDVVTTLTRVVVDVGDLVGSVEGSSRRPVARRTGLDLHGTWSILQS